MTSQTMIINPTMSHEKFGHNLKHVMEVLGMSQSELCERSGLTPSAISQIINGLRTPGLDSVCKIMAVVPVKFERLVI